MIEVASKVSMWDLRMLQLAKYWSQYSKDPSTKVGAVITDSRHAIKSVAFNGLPQDVWDDPAILENREEKYKNIIHAEINALIFLDGSVEGKTLYTWPFMPCSCCANIFLQGRIAKVVAPISNVERWQDSFKTTRKVLGDKLIEVNFK